MKQPTMALRLDHFDDQGHFMKSTNNLARVWAALGMVLGVGLGFTAPTWAQAQAPVRVVVGFAAGGPSDLVARTFAEQAGKSLGQTWVVDNRPGASALIATDAVASAKPDGLTLLAAATNHTMLPALYASRMKFDAAKSFDAVCTLASSDTVLVVGPSLPVKTLAEFLARARSQPGRLTYATPGQGSSPHLATEVFQKLAGLQLVHVPYKGAAPAMTDLMAGQVDFSMATVGSVLPHLKAGKLTALAIASRHRARLVPQVPTFEESGVKGYVVDTWFGLLAPAGTPRDVLRALEREAVAFAKSTSVRERLNTAGLEPHAVCGETFATQIANEIGANTRLAQNLGLKSE